MLFLKRIFFQIVGALHGLECFTDQDAIYHFDMKANVCNIPCVYVTERPKDMGDPGKLFEKFIGKLDPR